MQLGRYELLGKLGEGGFATVYRAWDPTLERHVALKLLDRLSDDPDVQRRFLAEARAIASLRHPNIVQFFDVGEADGRPFYTMEVIEGPTLRDLLIQDQRLPLERVVAMLKSLASAIDYLHGAGLVHRDIKASNVMLDPSWRVVLMDFGIVRAIDRTQHTRTGASLGTPEAMAPEQVRGVQVGPAADIYALGVLAYQLLAGRAPFVGDTAYVLHAQVYEAPPPLAALRPGLPEHVYRAVEWALAKEPEARPQSAATFVQAVEGTTPVIARTAVRRETGRISAPDAAPQRKRGRGTALVLAGVTAVALTGLAVGGAVLLASTGGKQNRTATVPGQPQAVSGQQHSALAAAPSGTTLASPSTGNAAPGAPATQPVSPTSVTTPSSRAIIDRSTATPAPPLLASGQVIPFTNPQPHISKPLPCSGSDPSIEYTVILTITKVRAVNANTVEVDYSYDVPQVRNVPRGGCIVPHDSDVNNPDELELGVTPREAGGQVEATSACIQGDNPDLSKQSSPDIYGRHFQGGWAFSPVNLDSTSMTLHVRTKVNGSLVELFQISLLPQSN